jgi:hypothetical protein
MLHLLGNVSVRKSPGANAASGFLHIRVASTSMTSDADQGRPVASVSVYWGVTVSARQES